MSTEGYADEQFRKQYEFALRIGNVRYGAICRNMPP